MSVFATLNAVNVNEHTEQKETDNGKTKLTYLSWPCAWAAVKTRYPDAQYTIIKDHAGLPYFSDPRTGIMVYTTVTIEGVTHEMWLPVMDSQNRAMRFEPYEIHTKYKTISVKAATMFDVNKTIMRCLTKNLAMFGLGLYIYAGEDLPEGERDETDTQETAQEVGQRKLDAMNAEAETCERCGKPIPSTLVSGKLMTSAEVAAKAREKFGGTYCMKCMVALKAARKNESD